MSLPPTPEKSLCIPYKMRPGFILTVNLYATDDQPPPTPCVFQRKCALHQPPPHISCVFSCKMRFGVHVTVNLHVMRPTAPGFRVFFQRKRAPRKPFQIPCGFSMTVRRAFKVILFTYDHCFKKKRAHLFMTILFERSMGTQGHIISHFVR